MYLPALWLGCFSCREHCNKVLWGPREKRREKQSPRIGKNIVGKPKFYLATWPRSRPAPAPALPMLALREALPPQLGPWCIFTTVQDVYDSDERTAATPGGLTRYQALCRALGGTFSLSNHYSNMFSFIVEASEPQRGLTAHLKSHREMAGLWAYTQGSWERSGFSHSGSPAEGAPASRDCLGLPNSPCNLLLERAYLNPLSSKPHHIIRLLKIFFLSGMGTIICYSLLQFHEHPQ